MGSKLRVREGLIFATKFRKEVSMGFIGLTSVFIWLLGIFLWVEPLLAEFSFKGKTVRMISPGSVGGGTDRAGRTPPIGGPISPQILAWQSAARLSDHTRRWWS